MRINIKILVGYFFSILLLTFISVKTFSQEMIKMDRLTNSELDSKFRTLSRDAAFNLLERDLVNKKFVKLNTDEHSYGFTGTFKDKSGKPSTGEFFTYDFYNKTTKQLASIIWGVNGKSTYKAHIVFPAGEKDFKIAVEKGVEMYVDANNKLQKASSWAKCFLRMLKYCPRYCYSHALECQTVGGSLGFSSIAIFVACAPNCASCYAWGALTCTMRN